jgi:hypothetical protein
MSRFARSSISFQSRTLVRPVPGFYVMRRRRDAPLVAALIYQFCPLVMPQPGAVNAPNPEDWRRPLDRSPRFSALINGRPVAVDRVWTSRSQRPVSSEEYAFRMGPLRRWSRAHPGHAGSPARNAGRSCSPFPILF